MKPNRPALDVDGKIGWGQYVHDALVEPLDEDQTVLEAIENATLGPACKLLQTSAQSIPDSTNTDLAFDTVAYDNDGMADTANDRITLSRDGIWSLKANVRGDFGTSTQVRIHFRVNGTRVATQSAQVGGGSAVALIGSVDVQANEGDHIEAQAFHDNGSSVNTNPGDSMPFLSVAYLGRKPS